MNVRRKYLFDKLMCFPGTRHARVKAFVTAAGILCLMFVPACEKKMSCMLRVRPVASAGGEYAFEVASEGAVHFPDTHHVFTSSMTCRLSVDALEGDTNAVLLIPRDVRVNAVFLDSADVNDLTASVYRNPVVFSPTEGIAFQNGRDRIPSSLVGQYDLVQQLSKIIPRLPSRVVSPGDEWENTFPTELKTPQGEVRAHVYQSLVFNEIDTAATGSRRAHVSWTFSRRIEVSQGDTTGPFIHRLPHRASGTGVAVLDLTDDRLIRAEIELAIPGGESDDMDVSWYERVSLVLLEEEQ